MFTLELVQAGSAAGSAQPGGGFAHISFIQLWIRSLSFALIFLFPRRKKWGEINKKRAEVAEAGSGNFEDEKPPRWCRLIYITKPSRGARCLFFSSFFNPQTELCIFSSCLQTSVILKMEIKKKRMITITCNWLSSNLLLFCGSDHFWGSMTLNLETNKTTSLKKKSTSFTRKHKSVSGARWHHLYLLDVIFTHPHKCQWLSLARVQSRWKRLTGSRWWSRCPHYETCRRFRCIMSAMFSPRMAVSSRVRGHLRRRGCCCCDWCCCCCCCR